MSKSKWRSSSKYKKWRAAVINRDSKCVICDSTEHLHAHHLASAAYHPFKRFKVSNGVTLCRGCHTNYHTNFNRSYWVRTTLYNFKNFQSLVKYLKGVL